MNTYVRLLVNKYKSFSRFYTLEVEISGHSVCISLTLLGVFPKKAAPILPTRNK